MENHLEDNKVVTTIKELSSIGYTITEIAEVLEIEEEKLSLMIDDKSSEIGKAYLTGKNELKFKTKKSIVDLAENGSMPAAMEVLKMIQQQETNERYH